MDIFAKLEDFYFDIEDKYYAFIDAMAAKGIPLYKVSDFLDDKGIPPFPVAMGLIGLFILGLISMTLAGPASGNLSVAVGYLGQPVDGITINLVKPDGSLETGLTDDYGIVNFNGLALNQDYTIKVSSDTYSADSTVVTLSDYEQQEVIDLFTSGDGASLFILLKNSETEQVIPEDTELSFQVCSAGICDSFVPEMKTKGWELDGLVLGSTIELTVESILYGSQTKTIDIEKDGAVKEVYLDPTGLSFLGDGQVQVNLVDSTGTPVEGVDVTLLNKVTNEELGTAKSNFEGRALVTITNGIPAYVYVLVSDETSNYASYNSSTDAGEGEPDYTYLEDNFDSPLLWGTITLKSGGVSSDVKVIDESGTGVYDANVRVMQGGTELGSKKTDFSGLATVNGLAPDKIYLFSAWAEGYIPAVMETTPLSRVDLQVESATSANSGDLTVEVQDEYGASVNNASVELYSSDGKLLGYPTGTTDLSGEAEFKNVVVGDVLVKADSGGMIGSTTVNVVQGSSQKVTIKLGATSSNTVRMSIVVTDSSTMAPILGAKIKFTDPLDGSLIVETDQTTESGVLLDVDAGTSADMWVTAEGYKDYTERIDFTQDITKEVRLEAGSDTPDANPKEGSLYVEFLGFYTSDCNNQLYTVKKNSNVCVKARINWPNLITPFKGGVHLRAGPDGTTIEDQGYYFTNMDFSGAFGNFGAGNSYNPTLSEKTDLQEGTEAKNKFVQVEFTDPKGSTVVNTALHIDEVELGSDVEIKYRAWIEKGNTWLRYPEDGILGTEPSSETKDALYANTYSSKLEVAEIAAKCAQGNLCISSGISNGAYAVDANKVPAIATDLYQGKVYGLLFYFISKEAISPAVTFKVGNANTNVVGYDFDTFAVASASGSGKQIDTSLDLSEQGLQKMWVYVRADETTDQTQYSDTLTITLKKGDDTLQVKRYTLVFKPIKNLELEIEKQSWQAGGTGDLEIKDLEIKVKDSVGFDISGAKVTLVNDEGEPLGSGTMTATTNTSGLATIDNFGSIVGSGIIKVTAEKENFKNDIARIIITSDGLQVKGNRINLPKDVRSGVIPISIFNTYGAVPAKNVTLEVIPIKGDYSDQFSFTLDSESLGNVNGRETKRVNVIANYTGPLSQTDPKPTARFKVLVKGEVEGLQIAETEEISVTYGSTYVSCVELSMTPADGVQLAGVTGETTDVIGTITNECDYDITVLTAKVTPGGEAYDSNYVDIKLENADALESEIEPVLKPGQEKEFTISITPKMDIGKSADKMVGNLKLDLLAYLGASNGVTSLIDQQTISFTLNYPNYALFVYEEADSGGCESEGTSEKSFSGFIKTMSVDTEETFNVCVKNNTDVPITDIDVIEPSSPEVLVDSTELDKKDNTLLPGDSAELKVTVSSTNAGTFTNPIKLVGDYGGTTVTREIPLNLTVEESSCLKITTPSLLLNLSLGMLTNTPILTVRNECSESVTLTELKGPGGTNKIYGIVNMTLTSPEPILVNETASIPAKFNVEPADFNDENVGGTVQLDGVEIYFTGTLPSNLDVKSTSLSINGAYVNEKDPVDTKSTRYAALQGCLNLKDGTGAARSIEPVFIPKIDYEGTDCTSAYCDITAFSTALQSNVETLDLVAGKITNCDGAIEETSTYCLFNTLFDSANSKTYYLMNDNISEGIIQNIFTALSDNHTINYWPNIDTAKFANTVATTSGVGKGNVAIITNASENTTGKAEVCGKYVITSQLKFTKSSGVLVPGWYTIILQMRYIPTSECNFSKPENFGLMLPSNAGIAGITALSGKVYFNEKQIPGSVDNNAVSNGYDDFIAGLGLTKAVAGDSVNTITLKLEDAKGTTFEHSSDAKDFRKTYGFGFIMSKADSKEIEFWTTASNLANESELGLGTAIRNYLEGSEDAASWCKIEDSTDGDKLVLTNANAVAGTDIIASEVDKVLFNPTDTTWEETSTIGITSSPIQAIGIKVSKWVNDNIEGANLTNKVIEVTALKQIQYNDITVNNLEVSFEVLDKDAFYKAIKAGNNKLEIKLTGGYAGEVIVPIEFGFEGEFQPTELVKNVFGFGGERSHAWDNVGNNYIVYLNSDKAQPFCQVYKTVSADKLNPTKSYYVPAVCGANGSGTESIDPTKTGLEIGTAVGIASTVACAAAEVGMAAAEIIGTGSVASPNVVREAITCGIAGAAQGLSAGFMGKAVWGSAKKLYDVNPMAGNIVLGSVIPSAVVAGGSGVAAGGVQIGRFASKVYVAPQGIAALKNAQNLAKGIDAVDGIVSRAGTLPNPQLTFNTIDNLVTQGALTKTEATSLKSLATTGDDFVDISASGSAHSPGWSKMSEIAGNKRAALQNAQKVTDDIPEKLIKGTQIDDFAKISGVSNDTTRIAKMDNLAKQTDDLVDSGKITQVGKRSTVKAKFLGEADKTKNPKWRSLAKSAISATVGMLAGGITYEVMINDMDKLTKISPDIYAMHIGSDNSGNEVNLETGFYKLSYTKSGNNIEVNIQPYDGDDGEITSIDSEKWFGHDRPPEGEE